MISHRLHGVTSPLEVPYGQFLTLCYYSGCWKSCVKSAGIRGSRAVRQDGIGDKNE